MSINYQACLILGLPTKELIDNGYEHYESEDIRLISPSYDGDIELVGIAVRSVEDFYMCVENLNDEVNEAKRKFKEETGLEGKLYLTTYSY